MRTVKLVVSGPLGAGKTQFIATASETAPLQTEVALSAAEEACNDKHQTTVAMDFGYLTLESGLQVHLYGTPGQARFEHMWEILAEGMQGLIFLVDATNLAEPRPICAMLDYFRQRHRRPILVCANKQDLPGAQALTEVRTLLALPETIPVLPLSAVQKSSVLQAVQAMISAINNDELTHLF